MVNVPDDGVNVPSRYKVCPINGHNDNGRIPFKNLEFVRVSGLTGWRFEGLSC